MSPIQVHETTPSPPHGPRTFEEAYNRLGFKYEEVQKLASRPSLFAPPSKTGPGDPLRKPQVSLSSGTHQPDPFRHGQNLRSLPQLAYFEPVAYSQGPLYHRSDRGQH